jgi:hypothetical protein
MGDEERKAPRRKYYAHRKGKEPFLSFEQIRQIFKDEVLTYIDWNQYLLEAEGYEGFESSMIGIWGRDIPTFILKQLQMDNIWPFTDHVLNYDLTTFFTVIEFIYDYVSKPVKKKDNIVNYDKKSAQEDYRERVNELLTLYCYRVGHSLSSGDFDDYFYELSKEGEIRERVQDGFKELIEGMPETDDPENIDDKIQYAVSHFLRYGATLEEKKDAVRTLGDVLEYFRDLGIKMPKKDDGALFNILNNFSIRHHERIQKSDYSTEEWYEFMFYLFQASIKVLIKLNKLDKVSKS